MSNNNIVEYIDIKSNYILPEFAKEHILKLVNDSIFKDSKVSVVVFGFKINDKLSLITDERERPGTYRFWNKVFAYPISYARLSVQIQTYVSDVASKEDCALV